MSQSIRFGLQKLTLLDYPGKTAATVFTPGCNFRCPFCHNADLVFSDWDDPVFLMGREEVMQFLSKRRNLLDGVCITGGEPLLHDEIFSLVEDLHGLGFCVKLDTNGSFPDKLEKLLSTRQVDYVAMDVKNSRDKYELSAGKTLDMEAIDRSIRLLLDSDIPYEFRTTVVKELHTKADMLSIADWISGARYYALQKFVDSGNLIKDGLHAVPDDDMKEWKRMLEDKLPNVGLRGL